MRPSWWPEVPGAPAARRPRALPHDADLPAKPPELEGDRERAGARCDVAREDRHRDGRDLPRRGGEPRHQLRPGGEPVGVEQRTARPFPQHGPRRDEPHREAAGEQVAHTVDPDAGTQQPGRETPEQPPGEGKALDGRLAHREVGARLDAAQQLRNGIGRHVEVRGDQHHGVPLVPVRPPGRLLEQGRARGPGARRGRPDEGEGQRALVALQHLRRLVGRSVVGHQQLVLPRALAEDLPDLPEQEPHRVGVVVRGDADVDHRSEVPSAAWSSADRPVGPRSLLPRVAARFRGFPGAGISPRGGGAGNGMDGMKG
jgi:hypothetical protein